MCLTIDSPSVCGWFWTVSASLPSSKSAIFFYTLSSLIASVVLYMWTYPHTCGWCSNGPLANFLKYTPDTTLAVQLSNLVGHPSGPRCDVVLQGHALYIPAALPSFPCPSPSFTYESERWGDGGVSPLSFGYATCRSPVRVYLYKQHDYRSPSPTTLLFA